MEKRVWPILDEEVVVVIKWLRLKEAAEKICGAPVEIHITTQLDKNIRGVILQSGPGYEVLLNAKWAKEEGDVVETLAHELAHTVTGTRHGVKWKKKMEEILDILTKETALG